MCVECSTFEVRLLEGLLLLTLTYLVGVFYTAHYLKSNYRELWESLGRPSILGLSILSSLKLSLFLLRSEYRALNDSQLAYLVWVSRFLLAVTFVFCLCIFPLESVALRRLTRH